MDVAGGGRNAESAKIPPCVRPEDALAHWVKMPLGAKIPTQRHPLPKNALGTKIGTLSIPLTKTAESAKFVPPSPSSRFP